MTHRDIPKHKAIKLREAGYSYNYISEKLNVAKSTLNYWLRGVPFIPNKETLKRIGAGKLKSAISKSQQKMESIRRAREQAVKDVGVLTKRDLFMVGIGLYMGEGSKTNGTVRVINSDPRILSFVIEWFKKNCGLTTKNFSVAIHIYPDNDTEKSLEFWSKAIRIPRSQFQKTQIDRRMDKKLFKRGRLPYGTAHLTIRSNNDPNLGIFLFRRIMAWIDFVINQARIV